MSRGYFYEPDEPIDQVLAAFDRGPHVVTTRPPVTRCPTVRPNGDPCDYVAGHPGPVHVTFHNGWPHPWIEHTDGWTNRLVVPDDPLIDAPEALK